MVLNWSMESFIALNMFRAISRLREAFVTQASHEQCKKYNELTKYREFDLLNNNNNNNNWDCSKSILKQENCTITKVTQNRILKNCVFILCEYSSNSCFESNHKISH